MVPQYFIVHFLVVSLVVMVYHLYTGVPHNHPFLANFLVMFNPGALKALANMALAHDSPLSRVWLGPKLLIVVKSPKYIEVSTSSHQPM